MAKKSNVNKFQAYAMVINIFIAYFFARQHVEAQQEKSQLQLNK